MIHEWPADKVERRAVEDLYPDARNARTHSETQVAQIVASIKEWGWTTPVLVDEAGSIIAGHGRVMAARKLGLSTVPVMVAVGWSEAQKRAYIIADNKLALNSGWDDDLLRVELDGLREVGFDLTLTGFGLNEFAEDVDIAAEQEESAPGVSGNALKFAGRSVPMTDEETEALIGLFQTYTSENGLAYGFVAWLCEARS